MGGWRIEMKLCSALILLLAWCPVVGMSGEKTISYTDRVTGGAASFTNSSETSAYELKRVEFTLSSTPFTNTFAITLARKYRLPDVQVSNVETSEVINPATGSGWITTNTQYYTQGAGSFTNTYTVATTTNVVTTQVYDRDDFGEGLTWEYEDVQGFFLTDTNNVDLIRVYEIKPRP